MVVAQRHRRAGECRSAGDGGVSAAPVSEMRERSGDELLDNEEPLPHIGVVMPEGTLTDGGVYALAPTTDPRYCVNGRRIGGRSRFDQLVQVEEILSDLKTSLHWRADGEIGGCRFWLSAQNGVLSYRVWCADLNVIEQDYYFSCSRCVSSFVVWYLVTCWERSGDVPAMAMVLKTRMVPCADSVQRIVEWSTCNPQGFVSRTTDSVISRKTFLYGLNRGSMTKIIVSMLLYPPNARKFEGGLDRVRCLTILVEQTFRELLQQKWRTE